MKVELETWNYELTRWQKFKVLLRANWINNVLSPIHRYIDKIARKHLEERGYIVMDEFEPIKEFDRFSDMLDFLGKNQICGHPLSAVRGDVTKHCFMCEDEA